jgi:hypothetical protein
MMDEGPPEVDIDQRTDRERAEELMDLLRAGALLGVSAQLWLAYHWSEPRPSRRQDAGMFDGLGGAPRSFNTNGISVAREQLRTRRR